MFGKSDSPFYPCHQELVMQNHNFSLETFIRYFCLLAPSRMTQNKLCGSLCTWWLSAQHMWEALAREHHITGKEKVILTL